MKTKSTKKNVTVLDDVDDDLKYVARDSDDDFHEDLLHDDFGREDSGDDYQPVIVNREEFLKSYYKKYKTEEVKRSPSPSPPRRTVIDDDDVVYRDKSGKRITKQQWLLLHQKDVKSTKKTKDVPKQELVWGKGLVQKEDEEEKRKREEKIAAEPFSRYDITEDYDKELQERQRWQDPLNNTNKLKEDDNRPKCRFAAVPNRFSIEPGYRWDGVIRGNGYEQRWFKAQADRNLKRQDYYMNNIADI